MKRVYSEWLLTESLPYHSLTEFFDLVETSESNWEYTVSWVDCLSSNNVRGIFVRANHPNVAEARQSCFLAKNPHAKSFSFPFIPPVSLINKSTIKAFNSLYFSSQVKQSGAKCMHYQSFFYPLDYVKKWNLMYGLRGFYQYQCVVPIINAEETIRIIIEQIRQDGQGSFLSVLKKFGDRRAAGMLSFPLHGFTLALDFPNQGCKTLRLMDRLDALVHKAGGRVYLAKDARMNEGTFRAGYPAFKKFQAFRDPGMNSSMSQRLMGKI
jgi:hypothetical protein